MPWGLAAAAVGAGASIYQGRKAEKAAEREADRARRAGAATSAELEEGRQRAVGALSPYARQEQAASSQLMAQMGLGPPPGATMGGATMGGANPWGFGAGPGGGALDNPNQRNIDQFIRDSFADYVAIAERAGYNTKSGKAQAEAARVMERVFQNFKNDGSLPEDFPVPTYEDMYDMGMQLEEQGFDWGNYARDAEGNKLRHGSTWNDQEILRHLNRFGGAEGVSPAAGMAQMGGPGGMPAGEQPGQFMGDDMRYREGPGAGLETVSSIMQRAGATRAPEGFAERYYADIEAPTPAFGMGYTENPAYQAMIEETMKNVNQGFAGAGGLYSGARGKGLREASARTQMDFYRDLADREQRAYEGDLTRRGNLLGREMGREDQYFTNYMNTLQSIANPAATTNIANIETGQAANMARIPGQTAAAVGEANLMGTQAQNQMVADLASGIGTAISSPGFRDTVGSWMGRGPTTAQTTAGAAQGPAPFGIPPAST